MLVKKSIWWKGLLGMLGRKQNNINILCASQSVTRLTTNPTYHRNTKHIDIKYHFVRQLIDEYGAHLKKVHINENWITNNIATKVVLKIILMFSFVIKTIGQNIRYNYCQVRNC